MKISSRGEIATVLTVLSLGLMLLGAVAGTKLATTPQQTKTLAAYPDWNWDEASVGCTDATCICGNISRINNRQSGGVCAPVCKLDGTQKCISNKWDDTWGCWGDGALDCKPGLAGPTPAGPTPSGPTPTLGGGPPPADCTAGEWKCNNNEANSDTKNLFCSVWCDGRNQWLYEASKFYFNGDGTKCAGKPSAPRSGGCPDTATPVPTRPPSGGGPPRGGNPPPGGETTPTPESTQFINGFYVVKGTIKNLPQPTATLILNPTISLDNINYSGGISVTKGSLNQTPVIASIKNDATTGSIYFEYGDSIDNYLIYSISSPIAPIAETSGKIILKQDSNTVLEFDTPKLNICFPYGQYVGRPSNSTPGSPTITPTLIPDDKKTAEYIINQCSGFITTASYDFANPPPEEPTPTEVAKKILTFNIRFNNNSGQARYHVVLSDTSCNELYLNNCTYNSIKIYDQSNTQLRYSPPGFFNIRPAYNNYRVQVELPAEINSITIDMIGDLYYKTDAGTDSIHIARNGSKVSCLLDGIPFTLNKGGISNDLGDLISVTVNSNETCSIQKTIGSKDTFAGSANADFQTVMDDYSQGKISAIDVSKFVSQLTRVPGLQTVSCDPTRGECNPGF